MRQLCDYRSSGSPVLSVTPQPTGVFSRLGATPETDEDLAWDSDNDSSSSSVLQYAGVLKKLGRAPAKASPQPCGHPGPGPTAPSCAQQGGAGILGANSTCKAASCRGHGPGAQELESDPTQPCGARRDPPGPQVWPPRKNPELLFRLSASTHCLILTAGCCLLQEGFPQAPPQPRQMEALSPWTAAAHVLPLAPSQP